MIRTHEVIWSSVAEKDLADIIEYIASDSLPNALRSIKNIRQRASLLNSFPERGRIVPELRDQGILAYRELIISPWRVIYRISGKRVYVLSVLDSRRNIEDVLLGRLVQSSL
jgi:toxin ParE1/3/4